MDTGMLEGGKASLIASVVISGRPLPDARALALKMLVSRS